MFYFGGLEMRIPNVEKVYLEEIIYLPILLIVLEKDQNLFEIGEFKLKGPYLHLIDKARALIKMDLKKAKAYLTEKNIKVVRGEKDDLFTEYHFYFGDTLQVRRYSNIRLRNHSEKLLKSYMLKTVQ